MPSRRPAALLAFALVLATSVAAQAKRPNVLWITSEDNAAHWLGCYGNAQAKTPRLDALAREGVRFERAYSNAPVCAVARSTILTEVYAVTQGTQHMRSRYKIPSRFTSLPEILRAAGYYCTNKTKTDYNIEGRDKRYWDACSRKAHYRDRPAGKPFFSIVNLTVSHESCLFPQRVKRSRKRGVIPASTRIAPKDVTLPRWVPDLPAVRRDFAIYHDVMTALDRQVGALLDELEREGLADDTIVFYYADHGGPTPRGKRYLTDSGVRVPMIVRVPEKWKALSPFTSGTTSHEIVSFIDLAPTMLSLAGVAKRNYMQGRAFLGGAREAAPEEQYAFLFGDRFDEIYGMRRGWTDGRWKYIRRFTPYRPAAPYSYYQYSMPSWVAMRDARKAGKLSGYHAQLWAAPQAVEELYELAKDPDEVENLASSQEYGARVAAMRSRLMQLMASFRDSGVVPEGLFASVVSGAAGKSTLADALAGDLTGWRRAFLAMSAATAPQAPTREALDRWIDQGDAVEFYWAMQALLVHPELAKDVALRERVFARASRGHATHRIVAAELRHRGGDAGGAAEMLVRELEAAGDGVVAQFAGDTLSQLGLEAKLPDTWIKAVLKRGSSSGRYVKRLAERMRKARAPQRKRR